MEICVHLKPILDHENKKGNIIREFEPGSIWGNIELWIYLTKAMDISYEKTQLQLEQCVRYYEEPSHHYRFKGFYCDQCNQTIVGPID